MCSLIEHMERDIRARQAEQVVITMPPQQGMTTTPREHAVGCTCRHSEEHGYVIGPACIMEWGKGALADLNRIEQEESARGKSE
jgi:hypothetical protein